MTTDPNIVTDYTVTPEGIVCLDMADGSTVCGGWVTDQEDDTMTWEVARHPDPLDSTGEPISVAYFTSDEVTAAGADLTITDHDPAGVRDTTWDATRMVAFMCERLGYQRM